MARNGIKYKKAVDLLLHTPGARLMLMKTTRGEQFFVVPGGAVDRRDAEKILGRSDVVVRDHGLFPNNPQSWAIGAG